MANEMMAERFIIASIMIANAMANTRRIHSNTTEFAVALSS